MVCIIKNITDNRENFENYILDNIKAIEYNDVNIYKFFNNLDILDPINQEYISILCDLLYENNNKLVDYLVYHCCKYSFLDVLKKLVEFGVDLNTPNTNYGEALMMCFYDFAFCTQEKIYCTVKFLLDYGVINKMNEIFIKYCDYYLFEPFCLLLLNYGYTPNKTDIKIIERIPNIIKNNNHNALSILIRFGFNVNTLDNNILKIIPLLIFNCRCEMLEVLLNMGMIINYNDPQIINAICYLIRTRRINMINFLILNGLNIYDISEQLNAKNFNSEQDEKMIKLLIDNDIHYLSIVKILCNDK
ncbi:ankyrin repeat protein [Acanthamoeba polyphaga moumouvirus]|uniref:Ankyrin repeat protein n=1 Tax=Acanthamoeba polyphaga moumouvirus TaxID=1269028 RepID=L7RD75_9VIRU|nr:ankyrin repeat protein [Acanthamoeba polyphaga moumouvirus]AGC02231.1 ankyrin repeat protein [Acanthamoeba polyphaga moumouvirus]